MRCEIVAVGTELLLGQIVDTNSAWLGERLALAGIDVTHAQTVGDNLDRIVADDDADVPALHGWRRELFGEKALALIRWQPVQWQADASSGGSVTSRRTCPQRQPPAQGSLQSSMRVPPSVRLRPYGERTAGGRTPQPPFLTVRGALVVGLRFKARNPKSERQ